MEREWVAFQTIGPNEKYGQWPEKRPIRDLLETGLVVIDKPMGPTSHQVTVWVQRMLGCSNAGHIGTLDPRVTGVLPIMLGRSTKLVSYLQGSPKEYVCLMRLHRNVDKERIIKMLEEFTGKIYQIPPLRSAVKRAIRIRTIHSINVLEIDGRDVLFRVRCEGGTYIRRLVHDIGLALGVGANMQELRRTESAGFKEDQVITLHDLMDAYNEWKDTGEEKWLRSVLRPVEDAFHSFKSIYVKDTAVDALCHGAPLTLPGVIQMEKTISTGDIVAIFTLKGELIGMGKALASTEHAVKLYYEEGIKKGIIAKMERIIMPRGTYPKMWG